MNYQEVTMSLKELDRLKVLDRVLSKQLTQTEAAKHLGLSRRHVIRLCKSYNLLGEAGLISKRRGQTSNNRIGESLRKAVIELIQSNYTDFGPTLAHEKLSERHQIHLSIESLRQLMCRHGLW